jgi:hypothetical protein
VTIGVSVFKSILPSVPVPPGKVVPPSVIIPFDYMAEFMKDTLISYGVPEKEAIISADVLIEADKVMKIPLCSYCYLF